MALKIIKKSLLSEVDQVYARNEAAILRVLNHKNVIPIIDFFENRGYMIIVLPLMQMTLSKYVKENKLNEQQNLSLFKVIVNGVTYCHKKRWVHCDLKLDNILVNVDSVSNKIKELYITDFGLSLHK